MSKLQLRSLDDFDDQPDIKSPLACLPLPDDAVLLPSNIIVLRVMRPDSVTIIDTVLEEADKTGSNNAAIIAAVPHRLPPPGNMTTVDADENRVNDLSECKSNFVCGDGSWLSDLTVTSSFLYAIAKQRQTHVVSIPLRLRLLQACTEGPP